MSRTATSSNAVLEQALAQVPGYVDADIAYSRLAGWRATELVGVAEHAGYDASAAFADAAATGPDYPAGIPDAIADSSRRAEARNRARTALDTAVNGAKVRRDSLLASHHNRALTWLHHQLQDLLGKVRAADLQGITDADAAIRAGKADQWAIVAELADQYADLRRAQYAIAGPVLAKLHDNMELVGLAPSSDQLLLTVGQVANFIHVDASWTNARRTAAVALRGNGRAHLSYEDKAFVEWALQTPPLVLGRINRDGWPAGSTPTQHLDRLAHGPLVGWVPTIPQLLGAARAARTLIEPHVRTNNVTPVMLAEHNERKQTEQKARPAASAAYKQHTGVDAAGADA